MIERCYQDITNNSLSNIFLNDYYLQIHCQKYHRSRLQFLEVLLSLNGLIVFRKFDQLISEFQDIIQEESLYIIGARGRGGITEGTS